MQPVSQRSPHVASGSAPTAEQSIAPRPRLPVRRREEHFLDVDNPAPLDPPVIPRSGRQGRSGWREGRQRRQRCHGAKGDPARPVALAPPARRVTTVPLVPTAPMARMASTARPRSSMTVARCRCLDAYHSCPQNQWHEVHQRSRHAAWQALPVHGRTIKVNLRGKAVGEYQVSIAAKFKAGGKVYKVRTIRSLSIIRQ